MTTSRFECGTCNSSSSIVSCLCGCSGDWPNDQSKRFPSSDALSYSWSFASEERALLTDFEATRASPASSGCEGDFRLGSSPSSSELDSSPDEMTVGSVAGTICATGARDGACAGAGAGAGAGSGDDSMAISSSTGWFTAWKPDVRLGGEGRCRIAPLFHAEMSPAPSLSEDESPSPKLKAIVVGFARDVCRNVSWTANRRE